MVLSKLLFIGMPGAGKGTQAKLLNFKHISTGEVIRRGFAENNPIVMPYKASIDAGDLLPDEQIFQLIEQQINLLPANSRYILDGAVRTQAQAKFVLEKGLIDAFVEFRCKKETAQERLNLRRKKEHREDDSPEAVVERFKAYYKDTFHAILTLSDEYHKKGSPKYLWIDAEKPVEEVHEDILKIISPSLFERAKHYSRS